MACPFPKVDPGTRLLLEQGMYDLALIDHVTGPTDRMKRIMMSPGVFERALHEMVVTRPEYQPLPTDWFNYSDQELYQTQVTNYRTKHLSSDSKQMVRIAFFGLDLGSLGGHYGAYYVTGNTVDVHDSMTTSLGPGPYARFFIQLAQDLFPDHTIHLETVSADELGLQPTGGFLWLLPSFMTEGSISDPNTAQLIRMTNVESQDHFCWAWSLLYLHSRVTKQPLQPLRHQLKQLSFPQVVVIKSYTWLLLTWLGLDDQFPEAQILDYFSIWDAPNRLNLAEYRRYQFSFKHEIKLREFNECLNIVFDPTNLVVTRIEAITDPPASCLA